MEETRKGCRAWAPRYNRAARVDHSADRPLPNRATRRAMPGAVALKQLQGEASVPCCAQQLIAWNML
eukprot:3495161-Pyramimonas_sp.AAC.1